MTLRQAIKRTMALNPSIQEATANRRATRFELMQSQARLLPTIDLSGDIGAERVNKPNGLSPEANNKLRTRRQATVTWRHTVFDGWERANDIYRDAARVDGAAYRLLSRSETLALASTEAYIDVYRHREALNVALLNVERHEDILRLVRVRHAGGKSSIGEVQQVQERLAAANVAALRIRQSLADARAKFRRVIGVPPRRLYRPSAPGPMPPSQAKAIEIGLTHNPLLLATDADVDAAVHDADKSKAAFYPKLQVELKSSYGRDLAGTPGRDEEHSGRLVLNWNLIDGGVKRYRQRELKARLNQAQAARDARGREITEQIERAYAGIRIGAQRVSTLQRQARVTRRLVRTYESEFRLSKRSLLDLLDAEDSRFSARIQLLSGVSVQLFARYRILSAMGILLDRLRISPPPEASARQRDAIRRHGLFAVHHGTRRHPALAPLK